ncbi:MAG TPA: hypothetical protein EYG86_07570 [Crocinitomicaceae bacterium]|nr:hypothetical protein [Crocinitomicaceae bacterium]
MDERKKFDFKRHVSPAASRKYILKILFYVVFLGALLYLIFSQTNRKESKEVEIDGSGIVLE